LSSSVDDFQLSLDFVI